MSEQIITMHCIHLLSAYIYGQSVYRLSNKEQRVEPGL